MEAHWPQTCCERSPHGALLTDCRSLLSQRPNIAGRFASSWKCSRGLRVYFCGYHYLAIHHGKHCVMFASFSKKFSQEASWCDHMSSSFCFPAERPTIKACIFAVNMEQRLHKQHMASDGAEPADSLKVHHRRLKPAAIAASILNFRSCQALEQYNNTY